MDDSHIIPELFQLTCAVGGRVYSWRHSGLNPDKPFPEEFRHVAIADQTQSVLNQYYNSFAMRSTH